MAGGRIRRINTAPRMGNSPAAYLLTRGALRRMVLEKKMTQEEYWKKHHQLLNTIRNRNSVFGNGEGVGQIIPKEELIKYGNKYLNGRGAMWLLEKGKRKVAIRQAREALRNLNPNIRQMQLQRRRAA